ncbi:hypothetical protein BD413DRAFT_584712 [Trametes elegans]|nr:hypothetical protein BD413DRAFT_584712 [Trametes elegans]
MTNNTSVNPSEVGWQFVPQYYTFVNKYPNRLHCFYNKSSTFIHGTEGEDGKPCFGQQEIHNKITSIGFQDCKVFIHSVDAQSSANGGIIIQVIGEMSNKGEAWRKFVQTFFLAEQPNGYFVLNDIFRFLKEESVEEGDEQEPEAAQKPAVTDHVAALPASPSPAPPPPAEPEPVPTPPTAPAPAAEEPAPSPSPAPEPQPQVNGHAPETKPELTPAPREPSPAPAPEPPATASPAPVSPPAQQHKPLTPAPAAAAPAPTQHQQPQQQQQPPPPQQAAPVPAPAAPAPSAPKTWASLAATGAKSWGTAVAAQSRGTSEAPAPSSASPAPLSGPQSPAPHVTTRPLGRQEPHPAYTAAINVQTPQCFVKSVTENVSDAALRTTLTTRFGPIKELEIVRSKACAFLEFTQLESARRAIVASLPIAQGGEGGIRIETDGGASQARILVETRKERGERPGQRGGAPINGDRGRGGFRGRGGPGRGRGGPPPKQ